MNRKRKILRREKAGRKEKAKKIYPMLNRNYKSSIFIILILFSNRKDLLKLYNAISGKQCKDLGFLEVNTQKNAIFYDH